MWLIKILNVRIVVCGYLNNAVFATADMEVYIALECSTTTLYAITASYSRLGNCGVFNNQCLLHVCIVISYILLVHKECDYYCNKHDVTCYCSCSCFCALPPLAGTCPSTACTHTTLKIMHTGTHTHTHTRARARARTHTITCTYYLSADVSSYLHPKHASLGGLSLQ